MDKAEGVDDMLPLVRRLASEDRDIYERGLSALISFIR